MATISKGITVKVGDVLLENLQEIPELGGTRESIEITTLSDDAHMYTDGILNYGDNLAFKFLYEKEQFSALQALKGTQPIVVTLPDNATCTFNGTCSVKLDGVGVNAAITYTLNVKPSSEMIWA
jgi:hypothetical protein